MCVCIYIYIYIYIYEKEMATQYSCLENSMDGGAWQATVHGVAKNQTRLSNFTFFLSIVSFREGNGNPLQCSCPENPMDGGAWWAAVYEVAESDMTEVTQQLSSSHTSKTQSFLWLTNNIPLYVCSTTSSSIHLLMNIQVASKSQVL